MVVKKIKRIYENFNLYEFIIMPILHSIYAKYLNKFKYLWAYFLKLYKKNKNIMFSSVFFPKNHFNQKKDEGNLDGVTGNYGYRPNWLIATFLGAIIAFLKRGYRTFFLQCPLPPFTHIQIHMNTHTYIICHTKIRSNLKLYFSCI